MEAPVDFYPDFCVGFGDPDAMFADLLNNTEWVRTLGVPREEYYSNDTPAPYTYGTAPRARTYTPQPWLPAMLTTRANLEMLTGFDFDVCFMNLYPTKADYLGWHADDSPEMDPEAPIATVTLGGKREINFREKGSPKSTKETLMLTHGSVAIMRPRMQRNWLHQIPKAGFEADTRISLTFRRYLDLGA